MIKIETWDRCGIERKDLMENLFLIGNTYNIKSAKHVLKL